VDGFYLVLGMTLMLACIVWHRLLGRAMTNVGNYDRLSFALSWLVCLPIAVLGIYFLWLAL
jgi:hypothetical protein